MSKKMVRDSKSKQWPSGWKVIQCNDTYVVHDDINHIRLRVDKATIYGHLLVTLLRHIDEGKEKT